MSDETLPLYHGELSGSVIIPERGSNGGLETPTLRSRRASPRKGCENIHVCFSAESESGQGDHAECPLVNISASGMAIEYDRCLRKGVSGHVSYYTISRIPVNISCIIRHCDPLDNGHFQIGLRLNRPLKYEERKPMRVGPGRVVSPHLRARKLRTPLLAPESTTSEPSPSPDHSGAASRE